MSKEQLIADCKAKLAAAQDQALSELIDAAQSEVPASPGGFSQEQVDQMLADKALADAQALASALDKAHADADAAVAGVQAQLDALSAAKAQSDSKLAVDEAQIQKMKDAAEKLQALMEFLKSLSQAPVSEPQPEQA